MAFPTPEEQRRALAKVNGIADPLDAGIPTYGAAPIAAPTMAPPAPIMPTMPVPTPMPEMRLEDAGAPPPVPTLNNPGGQPVEPTYNTLKAALAMGEGAPATGPFKPGGIIRPAQRQLLGGTSVSGAPKPKDYDEQMKKADTSFEESQKLLVSAAKKEQQGQEDMAQAQYGAAEDAAAKREAMAKEREAVEQDFNSRMKMLDDKIQNSADIGEDHFWKERGAFKQFTAGLSMALGAAGAALTGGPNYAMQIIDNAINRSIAAQEANLNKLYKEKESARGSLADKMRILGNKDAAIAAEKAEKWEMARLVNDRMTAGVKSEQVQAQAAKNDAMYRQEAMRNRVDALEKFAGKSSVQWGMTAPVVADATGNIPKKELPPELQERLVDAGGGRYFLWNGKQVPEGVREKMSNANALEQGFTDMLALREQGMNLPFKDQKAALKTAQGFLGPIFSKMVGQGAMSEPEREGFVDMLKDPSAFFSPQAQAAIQQAIDRTQKYRFSAIQGNVSELPEGYAAPRMPFQNPRTGPPPGVFK